MERSIASHNVLDISGQPKGAELQKEEQQAAGATEDDPGIDDPFDPEQPETSDSPAPKRPRKGAGLSKPRAAASSSSSSRASSQARSESSALPESFDPPASPAAKEKGAAAKAKASSVEGLKNLLARSGMAP